MRSPIWVALFPEPPAMTSPTPPDDGSALSRPLVDALRQLARGAVDVAESAVEGLLGWALGPGADREPQLAPVRTDPRARMEQSLTRSACSGEGFRDVLHAGASAGAGRHSEDAA